MTTQTEKVRKLRAVARSPNSHEAALALAKAQALESRTAKAIGRGLTVRVRRRGWDGRRSRADATVQYYCSRSRHSEHQFEILITEYESKKAPT